MTKAKASSTHVALLRGINVGGKHRLRMASLKEIFENAGATEVATYIQSGNVVFHCPASKLEGVVRGVEKEIEKREGFEVPIVTRTAEELAEIVKTNPFDDGSADPKALHVMILADEPKRSAVENLDPDRSPPDRFEVIGAEIFLHCPNGVARTKLTTSYFDAQLDTTSTMRNWRTVLKLLEMAWGS